MQLSEANANQPTGVSSFMVVGMQMTSWTEIVSEELLYVIKMLVTVILLSGACGRYNIQ